MKGRYLVAIAVMVFLLFVGMNVQFLCPVVRWSAECGVTDSFGKVVPPTMSFRVPNEVAAKEIAANYNKSGRTCSVIPIRECPWD